MISALARQELPHKRLFRNWVQKGIHPTEKPASLPFDRFDVLSECRSRVKPDISFETANAVAKTIALNTSVSTMTQTIYSPEMEDSMARDVVLPLALFHRIEAHNKAYKKASKWGSIAAAYTARIAIITAVGDTIGHIAKFINGQTDDWLSLSMKLLFGTAITFYIAKKLIPIVTHHVMRTHSESLMDKVTNAIRFNSEVPPSTARMIYDCVHTTCPHLPNLYTVTGRAEQVPYA